MELILPTRTGHPEPLHTTSRILVVIGANGSGKSSFGKALAGQYPELAETISGMHSLFIESQEAVQTSLPEENELVRLQSMIKERIFMPCLSAYEKLLLRLQGEEFEAAVNYKEQAKNNPGLPTPHTRLDQIQVLWEQMFPQSRLVRKSGFFELVSTGRNGKSYKAGRMSDGEKIVFYLIGAVLYAREGALLIIEEPELLLHNSIKSTLWNELEALRPDCTFVYLTRDIDLATSRRNSECIWIRSCNADKVSWDYERIDNNEHLPEEIYLEILGNRKPVLFIEGTDTHSIDSRLYPYIFPDYTIKPMGGCQKVIETTKAFRQLTHFHMLDSMGIVDRDRRTEGEVEYLRRQNIRVPDVAEVENLLMLEPVVRTVAQRMMKDPETVFCQVKERVVNLFTENLEAQVLLHARHQVRKKLEIALNHKISHIDQLAMYVEGIQTDIQVREIYHQIKEAFSQYIYDNDYNSILRVFNQKGMLPQSLVCKMCGLSNKESYLSLVLSILQEDRQDAGVIREAIKQSLGG
ncbi:MAG: DUF4435 domain-containing protein [Tannerellaceae bacterium]|nr:DUF4435 domain-containing protein [Tannerellaceae bacterium]